MQISGDMAAVVTGGASGLGAAVAQALATAGAQVTIFDMNEEAGRAQAASLGGHFELVDVSDAGAVAAGFGSLEARGVALRIVMNCAGIGPAAKTVSRGAAHDPALFAKVIGVNLIGSFKVI